MLLAHDENAELLNVTDFARAHTGVIELTAQVRVAVLVEPGPVARQGIDFHVGGRKGPVVSGMAHGQEAVAFADHGM